VAEFDPALFATWVDEVDERDRRDARSASWTTTHELIAVVGQLVSALNRNFVVANSKRGAQAPEVWKPRRPGEDNKPKAVSPRQMAAMHARG
jgi:hypothetical protein